jgi:protein O-GlcNAcase / histone acetyltransferase
MAAWGMNTYLYAPKDDLKHRALWRKTYTQKEIQTLRRLVEDARKHRLRFIYAIAPGLDIRYSNPAEFDLLARRLEQMIGIGCRDFALLFDDIPDRMHTDDRARWASFAEAQGDLTNRLFAWTRTHAPDGYFLFCPTAYCARMADTGLGGGGYLDTIGRTLEDDIKIFWTGPEIVSREISIEQVRGVTQRLRRPPLLWDNLFANDYDGRRFFCGPYAGRAPELRRAVNGILINPNSEFPLNYVPMRTCAEFACAAGSWNSREAYLRAMRDWLRHFATIEQPVRLEDLVLLGDAYYLPHEDGLEAQALFVSIQTLLGGDPATWNPEVVDAFRERAVRLRDCCARMAEVRNRPLFYALSRRVWELREELDLLLGYVQLKWEHRLDDTPARSDFHLPGTYRGGFVSRLQQLLRQHPDGTFTAQSAKSAFDNSTKTSCRL